ncbi:tyrosine-type recombinase/integrase [Flavobacteriaceae bacterium KMM 6898]|nr:tyrosine-type recombinase/integrase [Flavobacteriaceae bacterium KMM 6898]
MKGFTKKFSDEYRIEYRSELKERIKPLYTDPKLHVPKKVVNGRKMPSVEKGKRWYVYFYFTDPDTGKYGKPFKIYRDINSFRSIKDRRKMGNFYRDAVHRWLKNGFDPYEQAAREKRELSVTDTMSVRVALEYGLEHKKGSVKLGSYKAYANYVNLFLAWCADHQLDTLGILELQESHVIDYLNYLRRERPKGRGLKPTSVNNTKRHLGAIMSKLYQDKIVPVNFITNIVAKKGKPEKNQPFTEKEVRDIRAYCKEREPVLYDFLRFIFYSFMRNQEIVRIRVKDIDMDKRLISIPTKSDTLSHILMIEPMYQFLLSKKLHRCKKGDLLFTPSGKPGKWDSTEKGRVAYFSKKFLDVKDHFGLDANKTTYSFRHNAAVDLFQSFIANGLSEQAAIGKLMNITRHKSESALRNYLRDIGAVVPKDWTDSYNMDF